MAMKMPECPTAHIADCLLSQHTRDQNTMGWNVGKFVLRNDQEN